MIWLDKEDLLYYFQDCKDCSARLYYVLNNYRKMLQTCNQGLALKA